MERQIDVVIPVTVKVDETRFTPEFMADFRKYFYEFDTVDEHMEHLAQLYARELVDNSTKFIEGYGNPAEMGINFSR